MREFFINSFERLIGVILVIGAIFVVLAAITSAAQSGGGMNSVMTFVAVLAGGAIYLILMGGFAYLGLGIYHNTRRTAEAIERQVLS